MKFKASGRSALIIAAGLWICFWGPLQITESAAASPEVSGAAAKIKHAAAPVAAKKVAKHRHRHLKKDASARSRKSAEAAAKTESSDAPATATRDEQLPPAVANANAQLPAANVAAGEPASAKVVGQGDAQTARPVGSAANAEIVASDQLNELDLAVADEKPKLVAPPAEVKPANDDDAWSKSSLIGKIFIAFGGLLTLASAARMFMA
ncbi:MAG: hypothetical protein HXX15_13490 [Rhodopseudomonas sp.]|uniref:hypothetical protein n=1 Tax=Rhodopseudomonas sp. TaxID=1078 RepID=UPI00180DE7DB|nr:hypothetical protein [Rhodopseudomonas sp.]NVN87089.1 hypothetical protein [Rhodopseudomonas sp.]